MELHAHSLHLRPMSGLRNLFIANLPLHSLKGWRKDARSYVKRKVA